MVIGHPLVASANTQYGSSQVPNLARIQKVAARLFSAPGTAPDPVADAEGDQGPEGDPESRLLGPGPPAEPRQERLEVRVEPEDGAAVRARKPSATA